MVRPLEANNFKPFTTLRAALLSRPEVGSSNSTKLGDETSSQAMPTRFISPPLMPLMRAPSPIFVSTALDNPNWRMTSAARCCFCSKGILFPRRKRAAISTVSRTVENG
mmetsp:Transcript_66206/g.115199  ORF Transcript_66206/g.115199 Transcript_66206/m.115199 type:complete len:109 (-) Transcript_66206:58-384(-)